MLAGLITRRSVVQIHSSLYSEKGDSREEPGDIINSKQLQLNANYDNSTQNLQKVLFYGHKNNKDKFLEWLVNRKLSKNYIIDINNVLDNTLKLKFSNVLELRDKLAKVKNRKYRVLALRNLFNFFEEYEILDNDLILKLKAKIKITERSGIDTYIPSESQVSEFLVNVKHYDEIGYLFVRVLLESGLRVSEVQHFIKNIDKDKFEVNGEVVVYPLYYLRGTKSCYYIFMSKELYFQLLENILKIKEFNVEKLKTWIKRNGYLSLKYTRKFNFLFGINLR